jgi:hypothetical protein
LMEKNKHFLCLNLDYYTLVGKSQLSLRFTVEASYCDLEYYYKRPFGINNANHHQCFCG